MWKILDKICCYGGQMVTKEKQNYTIDSKNIHILQNVNITLL